MGLTIGLLSAFQDPSGYKAQLVILIVLQFTGMLLPTLCGGANDLYEGFAMTLLFGIEGVSTVLLLLAGDQFDAAQPYSNNTYLTDAGADDDREWFVGEGSWEERLTRVSRSLLYASMSAMLLRVAVVVPLGLTAYNVLVVPPVRWVRRRCG